MISRTITVAAALALVAAPVFAVEPAPGATLGTDLDAVSAALEEDGFALTEWEREDRQIELTAVKEGRRLEVYVDAETGEVSEVEEYARRGPWPQPGLSVVEIRDRLAAKGYELVEIERERRGRVEVEARRDGRMWEIEMDGRDGRILETEREDD